MLFRFLEHVRRQPKPVREQYALWLTVMLVGSIGLVWVVTLPGRFMSTGGEMADSGTEVVRPFMRFINQFQNADQADDADMATTTTAEPALADDAEAPATSPTQFELSPENLERLGAQNNTSTTSATVDSRDAPPPIGRPVLIATSTRTGNATAD